MILAHLAILISAFAQAPNSDEQLKALMSELRSAQAELGKAAQTAKTEAEKQKLYEAMSRKPLDYTKRVWQIVEKAPDGSFVTSAAGFLLDAAPDSPEAAKAVRVLLAHHVDNDKISELFEVVSGQASPLGEQLLRGVMTGSKKRPLRAEATVALGLMLKVKADLVTKKEDKAYFVAEAEKVLDAAAREYKDLEAVAKLADDELFEIRSLAVGKEAPDIAGEDGDGKPIKLSGLRGKVVVLDFWAEWCNVCMEMVPQQRALARRLSDKPFAIVGVNLDDSRDKQKKCEQKHEMAWRSFHDGREGPIAGLWKIRALPTIYVLDAKGVIRYKGVHGAELDEAVDALLRELK